MEPFKCKKCGLIKPSTEFSWQNKDEGKRHVHCKDCGRLRSKKHYDDHKDEYLSRNRSNKRCKAEENHKNVLEYYRTHPCVDCGEMHPACLQFDHVRGRKHLCVAKMLSSYKWETIVREIEKCEIRCANCHMKKTAKQRGWFSAA